MYNCAQRPGFMQVGYCYSVCQLPMLFENVIFNLQPSVESYLSDHDRCLALHFVESLFVKPNLHKTPCW
ncbi:MAG: hypothetical protein JWR61_1080 [Ferruginibacter sp.]|nr:hypothetical protein [Ferruginibacter sp.]